MRWLSSLPKGIKVILTINLILLINSGNNAYFFIKNLSAKQSINDIGLFLNLTTLTGILLVQIIIVTRSSTMLSYSRIILYGLALIYGALMLTMLNPSIIASARGLITIAVTLVIIFYLIGVRGYLNESTAQHYFNK